LPLRRGAHYNPAQTRLSERLQLYALYKHAGLWGYYDPTEVSISGDTRTYTRADTAEPAIGTYFCGICGCTTHWLILEAFAATHPDMPPRMGVNMRLFEVEAVEGVEVRFPDGRAW
jgi:hypothetical protein